MSLEAAHVAAQVAQNSCKTQKWIKGVDGTVAFSSLLKKKKSLWETAPGDQLPKEQDERRRLMGRGTFSSDTEISSEVISTDGKRK